MSSERPSALLSGVPCMLPLGSDCPERPGDINCPVGEWHVSQHRYMLKILSSLFPVAIWGPPHPLPCAEDQAFSQIILANFLIYI